MPTNTHWTIETYAAYNEAMRRGQVALETERDRRYVEVNHEREKAMKIKEVADERALLLARDIQSYKDEKANELREQIASERGLYATKSDLVAATEKLEATLRPMLDYIASDRGRGAGMDKSWGLVVGIAGLILTLVTLAGVGVSVVLYTSRQQQIPPIYTPAPQGTQLPSNPPASTPK